MLPGGDEAVFLGDPAHLFLGQLPQGKAHHGKLLLGQAGQEIRLVLGPVRRPLQQEPAGLAVPLHLGIVAGYHAAAAQLPRPLEQLAEFQIAVAVDAGVGGAAGIIGVHKFIDDVGVEFLGEIEYIVGNAHPPGHAAGVLHIVQRAAGLGPVGGLHLPGVQPHGGADALEARLLHQQRGHRAVHAAAHSDQSLHIPASFCLRVYQGPGGMSTVKAPPHNCVCGPQPFFCPTSAVSKMGNTYSIPAFLKL